MTLLDIIRKLNPFTGDDAEVIVTDEPEAADFDLTGMSFDERVDAIWELLYEVADKSPLGHIEIGEINGHRVVFMKGDGETFPRSSYTVDYEPMTSATAVAYRCAE